MRIKENKIAYKGTVENRSDSRALIFNPGDFVIVERGRPRLLILCCPCGCGDDLLINLDKRSGPAWRFYSIEGSYSLFPSYWRDDECGSHFIIWKNKIYWCYKRDDEEYDWTVDKQIEDLVLSALKEKEFTHYIDLADECDLIPWESLQACKQLSKKGLCISTGDFPEKYFKKLFL